MQFAKKLIPNLANLLFWEAYKNASSITGSGDTVFSIFVIAYSVKMTILHDKSLISYFVVLMKHLQNSIIYKGSHKANSRSVICRINRMWKGLDWSIIGLEQIGLLDSGKIQIRWNWVYNMKICSWLWVVCVHRTSEGHLTEYSVKSTTDAFSDVYIAPIVLQSGSLSIGHTNLNNHGTILWLAFVQPIILSKKYCSREPYINCHIGFPYRCVQSINTIFEGLIKLTLVFDICRECWN